MHMRNLPIIVSVIIGIAFPALSLAWTAPTSTPPRGDVSAPVNVGGVMQLKNGTLGVNALGVFGNTSGTTATAYATTTARWSLKASAASWANFNGVINPIPTSTA